MDELEWHVRRRMVTQDELRKEFPPLPIQDAPQAKLFITLRDELHRIDQRLGPDTSRPELIEIMGELRVLSNDIESYLRGSQTL